MSTGSYLVRTEPAAAALPYPALVRAVQAAMVAAGRGDTTAAGYRGPGR